MLDIFIWQDCDEMVNTPKGPLRSSQAYREFLSYSFQQLCGPREQCAHHEKHWVCLVFCLCINPVSEWRPIQGVPHFSAYGSWDRRQLPTPDSDKDKQKIIDGYMMETYWLPKKNKKIRNGLISSETLL